ncbi:Pyrimidine-specific ribonucleoside hydrolase RihA [bioreactor metagenome]|uniref:Pyrimidine-specific ribonucleoside hydrolase RihA n=1 Tax=bioreactor metagenome TaxID=1076179 RepID=A0A645BMP3_9ZZZZ|nr:nucleoside hydrolase [Christensenella sp.]
MKKLPMLLDCDTGVDDAVAILLCKYLNNLELVAATCVAGNVEVEKTTLNTLRVLELAGMTQIPVYAGAKQPLMGVQVIASHIHGENGLNDMELPLPKRKPEQMPAWDAIYEYAKKYAGELVIVAIGPLTNLALAIAKYKELPKLVKRIVIMGGAATGGNITPSAEFNVYADPEAADMVLTCGADVYLCGLDVTMASYFTPEELDELAALGSRQAVFARDVMQGILQFYRAYSLSGVAFHDPVTVLYADDDSYFQTDRAGVRVETKGRITRGKTVTDLYSDKQMEHNAYLVTKVDREAFKRRMFEILAQYGE